MIDMEKVVVDTDVVIDFLRTQSGLLPILRDLQEQNELEICLSSLTVMELYTGEMKNHQVDELTELLSTVKILAFDHDVAKFAGEQKRGKKLGIDLADFIIGVTSVYFGAKLATRNRDDFKGIRGIKFFQKERYA